MDFKCQKDAQILRDQEPFILDEEDQILQERFTQTLDYGKSSNAKKRISAKHEHSADEFMSFFTKKVVDIHQDTECWLRSTFTQGPGCQLMKFDALSCDDVTQLIRRIPPQNSLHLTRAYVATLKSVQMTSVHS